MNSAGYDSIRPGKSSWRRSACRLLAIGCLGILLVQGFELCFPYGVFRSSRSDAFLLSFAFHAYANDHDGRFPNGEGTPEASLCLLHPAYADAHLLHGKYMSASQAESILDSSKTLMGDQCRWHYVPGLTVADDARLALAWERSPRLDGSRVVVFVGQALAPGHETISAWKWSEFLAEQERLTSERDEMAKKAIPLLVAKVRLPSGQIVDRYDAVYTLSYTFKALPEEANDKSKSVHVVSGNGTESLGLLSPRALRRYRYGDWFREEGSYTLALTLGQMASKPVTVEFRGGRCTPDSVLFEMRKTP